MLTRLRNAILAHHEFTLVPAFKTNLAIARILKKEGFVTDYEVLKGQPQRLMKVYLKYDEKKQPFLANLERVSKPGLRVYVGSREIPRVYGGMGVAIVSTSKGVMTGQDAWHKKLGGELLCYVW